VDCLFLLLLRHWCCSFHPSKDFLRERERKRFAATFCRRVFFRIVTNCLWIVSALSSNFSQHILRRTLNFLSSSFFFFFSLRLVLFQPSWNREWFSFFLVVLYDFFSNLLLLSWQLPNLFLEDSTSVRQNLMSSAFLLCNGVCLQLLHRSPPISSGASSYIKRTTRGKLHTHTHSLSLSLSLSL
jgi:hypothetical protein